MDTIYLVFTDRQAAIAALTAAGYTMDEYNAHCSGDGWGPLFSIPDEAGHYCNLYDCNNLAESLQQYVVPAPLTPYNVRVGDEVQTVFRTVIVSAAIRDLCRALVVQMAGQTHVDMWSTGLSATGQAPATHYINAGPVRVELAAMLDDPALLAAGTGIPLEQAQAILAACDVSDDQPEAAMALLGLSQINALE